MSGGSAVPQVPTRKLRLTTPLMTGEDVTAAQQVLHTNRFGINFHAGRPDRQYGQKTAEATRLAKFLLGYPEAEVNGEFGPNL
jgi:peptidoglycan hydrolase-like protein with peptidoglycan-binding domain